MQTYFISGLLIVSALYIFCILFFGMLTQAFTEFQKNWRAKRLERIRETRRRARQEVRSSEPSPVAPPEEKPQKRYIGPVHLEGRWYSSPKTAALFLKRPLSEILSELGPVPDDRDELELWNRIPEYLQSTHNAALLHRSLPIGRTKKRLVISSYKGDLSKAYVRDGRRRIPIEQTVETGPAGDTKLLELASSI